MRTVTGGILIVASEQAFSHAFLIGFPHQNYAQSILLPFAAVAILAGVALLIFGLFVDRKPS